MSVVGNITSIIGKVTGLTKEVDKLTASVEKLDRANNKTFANLNKSISAGGQQHLGEGSSGNFLTAALANEIGRAHV